MDVWPVILAGGSGTRLWPLSREEYPKQLLTLQGSGSLLQETVLRTVDGLGGGHVVAPPLVVCNEEHRFLIVEQLREIGQEEARLILEPVGRNTAPALTVAALLARRCEADPVLLVLAADHYVRDVAAYRSAVGEAVQVAGEGGIGTLGVVPTHPETGYGYIHAGPAVRGAADGAARDVLAFEEKPNLDRAEAFVRAGDHLWNSGIFVTRATVWLDAVASCKPQMLEACRDAEAAATWDGPFLRLDRDAFERCPSDSIDYAVMEPITSGDRGRAPPGRPQFRAFVVPLDAGWSDIGSWKALLDLQDGDAAGNVTQGDVYIDGSEDSLVVAEHRFVAAIGIRGVIVVETPDAVLVADKERSQDVRAVVAWLKGAGREEGRTHRRVYRPWGSFETIDSGDRFEVKRLRIKPGGGLSLQKHHHRAEHWVVVSGTANVRRADESFQITENESAFIPIGVPHALDNPGRIELEIIEVRSGSYLGEDDIVRLPDR